MTRRSGTLHQCIDINTRNCDGQKTYCGQYRETSANIIRNNEGLVPGIGRKLLKCATFAVGGYENTFSCAILTVLFFQKCAENAECNGRFGSGTRLGNNVNANVATFAKCENLIESGGTDGIARKIDVGSFLL